MPSSRAMFAKDISQASMFEASKAPSLFGQIINDVVPLMGGTAKSGCLVLVSIGGAIFGVTASHSGEWELDTRIEVPLSGRFDLGGDGHKKLLVMTIDADGHIRAIQGEFEVSTVIPEAPTLATIRVFRHLPLIDGHAERASQVEVTVGGATYTVTAGNNGAWSVDTACQAPSSGRFDIGADGRKLVSMACTNLAGNTSVGRDYLLLDTSANVSILPGTLAPRLRAAESGEPIFAESGSAWKATFDVFRGVWPHSRRN